MLIITAVFIWISYVWLDKSLATFADGHHLPSYVFFEWFTYIPKILVFLAPFIIIVYVIKRIFLKQPSRFSEKLFIISITLIVMEVIKDGLKFVFGRYWPNTWIQNNPSWLKNHAYGFHWFHSGAAYQSFPSGHTVVIFTVMSMLWILFPKYRWIYGLICLLVCLGLLGMHYHFLSDIIAGATIGTIGGVLALSKCTK